jgi:hypothetical protein
VPLDAPREDDDQDIQMDGNPPFDASVPYSLNNVSLSMCIPTPTVATCTGDVLMWRSMWPRIKAPEDKGVYRIDHGVW